MIREFQMSDTEHVMKLWLSGNISAHSFVPEEYWHSHFDEVQEALLQAKVLVCDIDGNIKGFIGLMNEYIAGIFVDKSCRSTGRDFRPPATPGSAARRRCASCRPPAATGSPRWSPGTGGPAAPGSRPVPPG